MCLVWPWTIFSMMVVVSTDGVPRSPATNIICAVSMAEPKPKVRVKKCWRTFRISFLYLGPFFAIFLRVEEAVNGPYTLQFDNGMCVCWPRNLIPEIKFDN